MEASVVDSSWFGNDCLVAAVLVDQRTMPDDCAFSMSKRYVPRDRYENDKAKVAATEHIPMAPRLHDTNVPDVTENSVSHSPRPQCQQAASGNGICVHI